MHRIVGLVRSVSVWRCWKTKNGANRLSDSGGSWPGVRPVRGARRTFFNDSGPDTAIYDRLAALRCQCNVTSPTFRPHTSGPFECIDVLVSWTRPAQRTRNSAVGTRVEINVPAVSHEAAGRFAARSLRFRTSREHGRPPRRTRRFSVFPIASA